MSSYEHIEVKKLPNSEAEVSGEITLEAVEKAKAKALANLSKEANMPGFRKGNVPREIILKELGELKVFQEAAYLALEDSWMEILQESKLPAIGNPHITITKLAPGNPVGFKISVALYPELKLPDYKKIAATHMGTEETISVTEKEIDDVVLEIRKHKAHEKLHETNAPHDHEKFVENIKEGDLPEVNEDFVKTVGTFKNVTDFREKIKENLTKEKEWKLKDKKRGAMIDLLVNGTEGGIPELLTQKEIDKMLIQFKGDVEQAGGTYEAYLKQTNKKEEDIRKDWHEAGLKRAKLQLIIEKIAELEKIEPEKDQVEKEVEHIMKHHKDVSLERAQTYVHMILTNEKVLGWLEKQK